MCCYIRIRGLFDLLKRNVVTNIGGMYAQRLETREIAQRHIHYVQEVLAEVRDEAQRMARARRRG